MIKNFFHGIRYQDQRFDEGGWVHFYQDERFDQRFRDLDGLMYCETILIVRSSIDAAASMLCGPWTWWDHGRSMDFRLNEDLSCFQYLKPANWFWTKIGMRIFPPVPRGYGNRKLPASARKCLLVAIHRGTSGTWFSTP